MTRQSETLALLRANPYSTVKELVELTVPNGDFTDRLRASLDINENLRRLAKKGDVMRTDTKPNVWVAVE